MVQGISSQKIKVQTYYISPHKNAILANNNCKTYQYSGAEALSNYAKSAIHPVKFGAKYSINEFAKLSFEKMSKEQNIQEEEKNVLNSEINKILSAASTNYLNLHNIAEYLKINNNIPTIPFLIALSDETVNVDSFFEYLKSNKGHTFCDLNDFPYESIPAMYATMYFNEYANKKFEFDTPFDEYIYFNKLFASNGHSAGHTFSTLDKFAVNDNSDYDDKLEYFKKNLADKTTDKQSTERINTITDRIITQKNCDIQKLQGEIITILSNLQTKPAIPFSRSNTEKLKNLINDSEFRKLSINDKKIIILADILKDFHDDSKTDKFKAEREIFYAAPYIDKLNFPQSDKSKLKILIKHRNCFDCLKNKPTDTNVTKSALELRYLNSYDLLKILSNDSFRTLNNSVKKKLDEKVKYYNENQFFIAQEKIPHFPKGELHIIEKKPTNVFMHGLNDPFFDEFGHGFFNSFRLLSEFRESDYVISTTLLNDKDNFLFGSIGFILDVDAKDMLLGHDNMDNMRSGMKKNMNTVAHILSLGLEVEEYGIPSLYSANVDNYLANKLKKCQNIKNNEEYQAMLEEIKNCKYIDDLPEKYKAGFQKFQNSLAGNNEIMIKSPKITGVFVSKSIYPSKKMIPDFVTSYAKAEGLPLYYF